MVVKVIARIATALLFVGFLCLGMWLGNIISVKFYGCLSPFLAEKIEKLPGLYLFIYFILLAFITLIILYMMPKLGLRNLILIKSRFLPFSFLSVIIGFMTGIALWIVLQIYLILAFVVSR